MSKIDGSRLVFGKNDVVEARSFIPRLVRNIFFGRGITHDEYVSRFHRHMKARFPFKTRKERSQKISTDLKFISEPEKITFSLAQSVLTAMGFDIECLSIRIRDRNTDETFTFSTDQTADELDEMLNKENEVGIKSLI